MLHWRCGGRRPIEIGMHFECFLYWLEGSVLCRDASMPHSDSLSWEIKAKCWWFQDSWALLFLNPNTYNRCSLLSRPWWFPCKCGCLLIWVNWQDGIHLWGQCMYRTCHHYYHSIRNIWRRSKNRCWHITRSQSIYFVRLKRTMLCGWIGPSWFDPHLGMWFHYQWGKNRFPIWRRNVLWRVGRNKNLHR